MYDELDIFEKECSNDQFRFDCMVECMVMDAEMSLDEYTTEGASDIFEKMTNAVKNFFEKFIKSVKAFFKKISDYFTSNKLKYKYERLLKEAKTMERLLSEMKVDSTKLVEELEKIQIENLDLAKEIRESKGLGDYIIAAVKNLESKANKGEKITADDVAKIRQEALNKADGLDKKSDEHAEYIKMRRFSDLIGALSVSGPIGIAMGVIDKCANGGDSFVSSCATGASAAALTAIIYKLIRICKSKYATVVRDIHKKEVDSIEARIEPVKILDEGMATQLTSLSMIVQKAETMSYRRGVRYLTKSINEAKKTMDELMRLTGSANVEGQYRVGDISANEVLNTTNNKIIEI